MPRGLGFSTIELDRVTCDAAADIAEITGARTLDGPPVHLPAGRRASGSAVPRLVRRAQAHADPG